MGFINLLTTGEHHPVWGLFKIKVPQNCSYNMGFRTTKIDIHLVINSYMPLLSIAHDSISQNIITIKIGIPIVSPFFHSDSLTIISKFGGCLKWGTSKSSILFSDFPWNKPSSELGVPWLWKPPFRVEVKICQAKARGCIPVVGRLSILYSSYTFYMDCIWVIIGYYGLLWVMDCIWVIMHLVLKWTPQSWADLAMKNTVLPSHKILLGFRLFKTCSKVLCGLESFPITG